MRLALSFEHLLGREFVMTMEGRPGRLGFLLRTYFVHPICHPIWNIHTLFPRPPEPLTLLVPLPLSPFFFWGGDETRLRAKAERAILDGASCATFLLVFLVANIQNVSIETCKCRLERPNLAFRYFAPPHPSFIYPSFLFLF